MEEELAELRRKHLAPRSLTPADVAGENLELLAAAEERAARRVERMGPVNPLAEQECAELEERAAFLAEQRRDLEASLAQLAGGGLRPRPAHRDLVRRASSRRSRRTSPRVIATVFPGAKGSLKLVEGAGGSAPDEEGARAELDEIGTEEAKPPVRGIGLEVKFANKSPRSLSLLSGGEKAMAAIAFLFRPARLFNNTTSQASNKKRRRRRLARASSTRSST